MIGAAPASGRSAVLFISSAEQPGADTFIHTLIMRELDRARFDVHVAYSAGPSGTRTPAYAVLERIPNLHLRPTNFGPSFSKRSIAGKVSGVAEAVAAAASLAGLAGYIRQHRIAVVHSTDRPRDAMACALVGRLSPAKTIIHAHLRCAEWMGRSLRWAMGQVDGLMAISEFVAASLVDCGYSRERIHTVLNAIDVAAWDPRLDGAPVRQELAIPLNAPVIACAARLFRGKGQDEVIRALPSVQAAFPDVRLLIIGDDDRLAQKASFTAELRQLAADLGVSSSVIFTGRRNDMAALMAACDVFALPSNGEPFGLVFLEAMAMKRPVVALANGGTIEVVEHGKSGLLSAAGDGDALAANLRTLLGDPALRIRMGEYGRRQVEARFTARRMADDAAGVYAALTGRREAKSIEAGSRAAL